MSRVTVPLVDIASLTPRSRLLTMALGDSPFTFAAGQAVMVAPHGAAEPKPYSIASSPDQVAMTRQLELLIGIDTAGPDLDWAERGAMVDLDGPFGSFTLPSSIQHARLLFVAGGTGIAPLRSMLGEVLLREPHRQVSVLYSARRADEFAFIDELRTFARAGRLELHQTVTRDDSAWQGLRGRIGRAQFEAVVHQPRHTLCFVCGPAAMVEGSVTTLHALGIPHSAIRTEHWGK